VFEIALSDISAKGEEESDRGSAVEGWDVVIYMTVHPAPVVPRWTVQPEPVVPRMAVHSEPIVPRWTVQPEPVVPRAEEEFSLLLEGILNFLVEIVSRVDYKYVCLDKIISLQMGIMM
jgi:hypothetical protein